MNNPGVVRGLEARGEVKKFGINFEDKKFRNHSLFQNKNVWSHFMIPKESLSVPRYVQPWAKR
jgi:hypothetical protein